MIILKGWNSFYEGWLHAVFDQPKMPIEDDGYLLGYQTAQETSKEGCFSVIPREIELGHIVVKTEFNSEFFPLKKSDRPIPSKGELYKHYENQKTYKILGVSFEANTPIEIIQQHWTVTNWAVHKKTGDAITEGGSATIALYDLPSGLVLCGHIQQYPNHVAYQSIDPLDQNAVSGTTTIWITPVEEFMAVLKDGYRFTKLDNTSPHGNNER